MAHDYLMLSTKDSRANVAIEASREADLRFISQNQKLEGFSGEITEAMRQHKPNMEELKAVSKRFGAQAPQGVRLPRRGKF